MKTQQNQSSPEQDIQWANVPVVPAGREEASESPRFTREECSGQNRGGPPPHRIKPPCGGRLIDVRATPTGDKGMSETIDITYAEIVHKLRRVATCVYIAVEKSVADDIAQTCRDAADIIASLSIRGDGDGENVRFVRATGQTFEEMRSHLFETDLYNHGDCILVWVNEGDFWMVAATEEDGK
jgi:hypothetical protein